MRIYTQTRRLTKNAFTSRLEEIDMLYERKKEVKAVKLLKQLAEEIGRQIK